MTNTQLQILHGSLLGDGYLACYGRAKNAMYKLKQSVEHSAYVQYMYEALGDYVVCGVRRSQSRKPSRINNKINHSLENWDGTYCWSSYFWTKSDPVFTHLFGKWYKNGVKVVPQDLVLTPLMLSHWYAEDGSNNVTHKSKCVFLNTHAFSETEVDFLVSKLDVDLGIKSKWYKGPVIRVRSGSYFDFIDMVSAEIKKFVCFDYKIDVSKAPSDRKGKPWDGPKLSLDQARKIRHLRSDKVKLKDIAKIFGVSVATIGKIANHQMYKEPPIAISGSADVKLGLKYGNQR